MMRSFSRGGSNSNPCALCVLAIAGLSMIFASIALGAEAPWYPSVYGAEDSIGAANNLSEDGTLAAAKLVTAGKVYSLAVPLDPNATPRSHRVYRVTVTQPGNQSGKPIGPNKFTVNDDSIYMWQGLGTQIDGFAHASIDFRFYNGASADEFVRPGGVTRFSVHAIPPLVTRGVLLDMAGLRNVDSLEVGDAINHGDIEAALKRQSLRLKKGDVVLLHTGWMDGKASRIKPGAPPSIDEPGLGIEGAAYLSSLGVVAIGADNDALEVVPAENPKLAMPVHQELLVRNDVYILENIVTRDLARDRVWEFLFVLAAPRLMGTVQGNAHPVAIK